MQAHEGGGWTGGEGAVGGCTYVCVCMSWREQGGRGRRIEEEEERSTASEAGICEIGFGRGEGAGG
jgi:hypothetical protein